MNVCYFTVAACSIIIWTNVSGGINRHGLTLSCSLVPVLFSFLFLEGGDLIIVVLIILIFGHTRSGKGKKHQKHPRSPQPTPQKAGPGGHTGGWILPWETEALSFCPASLMLPYPQFSDPVSFSLLFYFIFGEGKKRKLFSALSLVWEDLVGCFGLCFLSTYLSQGFQLTLLCRLLSTLPVDGSWGARGPVHPVDPLGPWVIPGPACAPILPWSPTGRAVTETSWLSGVWALASRMGSETWKASELPDHAGPAIQELGPVAIGVYPSGPEPFHLEGGLCRVQLWARLHPLAGWQSARRHSLVSPRWRGSSQGLDLWKMENQAPKVLNCNREENSHVNAFLFSWFRGVGVLFVQAWAAGWSRHHQILNGARHTREASAAAFVLRSDSSRSWRIWGCRDRRTEQR